MQSTKHQLPGTNFPVCIEAPEAFVPKARYAIEMLLLPMRMRPLWVKRGDLGGRGLYYGMHPDSIEADGPKCRLHPSTPHYFDQRLPYPVAAVRWQRWEGSSWPVLFPLEAGEADWIASAFFWLSGWQEYTNFARDVHGRFPYQASLQARWDLATRPVVEVYRRWLAELLKRGDEDLQWRSWGGAAWALCATHDIDYLWKWRPGMIWRESIDYMMLNRRNERLHERLRRARRVAIDMVRSPDTYRESWRRIAAFERDAGVRATYFVKTGAHGSQDVRYDPQGRFFRRMVRKLLGEGHEIGLHPSYHAHTNGRYLQQEKSVLEAVVGRPVSTVRQHFLRYDVPRTPRQHERSGFVLDATLGFAEHEGFRYATCLPFRVFDAWENAPMDLWELPLAAMDTTLFRYRSLSLEEARAATASLVEAVQRFRGVFVPLWHNVLYDALDFSGWHIHFEQTLRQGIEEGARLSTLSDALEIWLE